MLFVLIAGGVGCGRGRFGKFGLAMAADRCGSLFGGDDGIWRASMNRRVAASSSKSQRSA